MSIPQNGLSVVIIVSIDGRDNDSTSKYQVQAVAATDCAKCARQI